MCIGTVSLKLPPYIMCKVFNFGSALKAGGSGRAARAMALTHFKLSDHVTLNG